MPRRNNSSRKRGATEKIVETVAGADFHTFAAATSDQLLLAPGNFTRLSAISDNFQMFRFRKVIVEYMNGAATAVSVGYVPGTLTSYPSTIDESMQLEPSSICFAGQTVKTTLVVNSRHLLGEAANKWFKTRDGASTEAWSETQGVICLAQIGSTAVSVIIRYECELTGWVAATNTPKVEYVEVIGAPGLFKAVSKETSTLGNRDTNPPSQPPSTV